MVNPSIRNGHFGAPCLTRPLAAGRWPLAAGPWPLAPGPWPLAAALVAVVVVIVVVVVVVSLINHWPLIDRSLTNRLLINDQSLVSH